MPNPWDMNWGAPQASGGGLEAVPLPEKPRYPTPQTATQAAIDAANLALKQRELAKPAGAANLTAEDRGKFTRQRQGALGLKQRIGEIEQLYADAFRGAGGDAINPATGERTITQPGLGSAAEYLPGRVPIIGRPINEVFKNASGSLMGDLAAAYGLTAQQQNTPVELEIRFGPFIPKAGDPDDVIEAKIRRLKEIAGEQERQALSALGEVSDATPAQSAPGTNPTAGDEQMTTAPGIVLAEPDSGTVQSSTRTKTVTDEALAAIAPQIGAMVTRGLPAANIKMFMKKQGVDPAILKNLDEILAQRNNPKSDVAKWIKAYPGQPYPVNPQYEQPLEGFEKGMAETAAGPFGAFGGNAVNAATAGNLEQLSSALGAPEGAGDQALSIAQAEHPYASLGGTVAGGVGATLGAEAGLARLGMGPGLGRALLADTAYGGAAGASNAPEGGNWLNSGAKGALAALVGSGAGQGLTRGLGSVTRGVSNPSVRAVLAEDIPTTLGQTVSQSGPIGRFIKGVEDRAAGLGVDGGQINARRMEGVQAMNSKAFDKALEPIKSSVNGKIGEEAVSEAQGLVSQAFTSALAGKAAVVDRPFITQAAAAKNAIQSLPRVGAEVESSIDEVIGSYFDPATLTITGENMQALLRDLGQIKRSYAGDPLGNRVGRAVDQVEASIEGLFNRQAPEVMPMYGQAKQAYKRLSTVEDAVLRAKNTGGVFTPAQLGMADRTNTTRFGGKKAAAAGKGEFHDFQRPMQDVLPSQVPDSGTAGRLAVLAAPAVLGGGGYAAGGESGATTGLTLAALLAAAYTRTGQKALTGLVAKRGAGARKAGETIRKGARVIGSGAGTTAALETTRGQ